MISEKVREYVVEVSKRENTAFTDTDINKMIELAESKREAFKLGFLLAVSAVDDDKIENLEQLES